MERTKASSTPNPSGAIARPVYRTSPDDKDPGSTVVVWDHQRTRLQLINHIISECGARSRSIEALPAIQEGEIPFRCSVALVGLGGCPSAGDFALNVIRTLKQKGLKIICYEDKVSSWPLGLQCLPLLAGSLRLLDSTSPDFVLELQRLLNELLLAETTRQEEEEQIRSVMKELGIVGESEAMISIFRWVRRVSVLSDLPILITGETGTGKQILADAIYHLDPKRRNGPFIALNCGAISPGLAESELFGHRRGAFTGADRDRKGLIRSAQGGILFLDEIGEMDDALQTKLLRILQENRVLGVGEDQEIVVDVRVIAATNQDLDKMVQQRKFRVDLFHRLNVLSIHIPPLRERLSDVKPLIEHFLQKYRFLKPGAPLSVASDFVEAVIQVGLPGNVRQLENLVQQVLVNKGDDSPLNFTHLPAEVWRQLSEQGQSRLDESGYVIETKEKDQSLPKTPPQDLPSYLVNGLSAKGWSLSRSLEFCERLFLQAAFHEAHGNQSQTARLLGITPRSVYNKLRKHNLNV